MPAVRRFGLFVLASVCILASVVLSLVSFPGLAGAEVAPPETTAPVAPPPTPVVSTPPPAASPAPPAELPSLVLRDALAGLTAIPEGTVLENGIPVGVVTPEQLAIVAERPAAAGSIEAAFLHMSQAPGEVQLTMAIRFSSVAVAQREAGFAPAGASLAPVAGLPHGHSFVLPKPPATLSQTSLRFGRDLFIFTHIGPNSRIAELEELARRQSGHLASLGVVPEAPAGSTGLNPAIVPIAGVFVLVGLAVGGWLVLRRSQGGASQPDDDEPMLGVPLTMADPTVGPTLWDPVNDPRSRSHDAWRDTSAAASTPPMVGPTAAQPGYPQPAYPQAGYPAAAQPGYPQPAYPAAAQPGYPQAGYPQATHPGYPPAPPHPPAAGAGWPGAQYSSPPLVAMPNGAPPTVVAGPPAAPGPQVLAGPPPMPATEPPPGHPEHIPSPVERSPMTAWPHQPGLEAVAATPAPARPSHPPTPPAQMARTSPQRQQTAQTEQLFDAAAPIPLSSYQRNPGQAGGTSAFELMGPPQSSVRGTTPNRNLVAPAGLGLTPPPKPKAKRTLPAGAVPPPPPRTLPPPPRPGT